MNGSNLPVHAVAIPTGGAIMLNMDPYIQPAPGINNITISIATSSGSGLSGFTQIYSGAPIPRYLDVGDSLPQPLDGNTAYVYQVMDNLGGSVQTEPVTPSWAIENTPDQLTQILMRLLQGAINNMPLPQGIQKTQVMTTMPMNGYQAMPFIIASPELIQQTDVQLGDDYPNPDQGNNWTLWALVNRIWRVSVMSVTPEERDFYRDQLLAAFRVFKATAFGPLGIEVTHKFQAASYTSAEEHEGHIPGFYGADLMYELQGIFPVTVLTNYGVIKTVEFDITILPPPGTQGTSFTAQTK